MFRTRIQACVVAGPVTTHASSPSLAVFGMIVVQGGPAVRESWIWTLPLTPTDFQRIVWLLPIGQTSPLLGRCTVSPVIAKSPLLLSLTAGSATLTTRMRALAEAFPF